MKFKPLLFLLLLFYTGCNLLLQIDQTPPVCIITSPTDSSTVSGIVTVSAEAFDSVGIATIEFYINGTLFGREKSNQVTVQWDTRSLSEGTWHHLFCIATDLSGNRGYSDTVNVLIRNNEMRNVFHGQLTLPDRYYRWVEFSSQIGETLFGDLRTATPGTLSRFLLLDEENFNRFRANQSYTARHEEENIREFSLSYYFTASGIFYLLFANTTGTTQTYWARFFVE
ncbi:MAG: Ig-like domain-containing protein [bacterium]